MLTTQRTFIRPIQPSDSEPIFRYRSDAMTNKYQGFIPKTLQEVDDFIATNPTEINQKNTWFQLVIIEKITNQIIGDIGIHFIGNDGFQCEIGCTLDKNYHGKGLATETLHAVISYLFKDLNKHRIVTSIDPENISSIRLVERLGFRKEGHFKKSLFINGEWVDDVIYALLGEEFLR
ncbi:MAG: GNAT family N-acetyltransferase [Saprospiraceae bacterium]